MAVAFSAVGPSGGGGAHNTGSNSLSWSHVVGSSDSDIFIGISASFNSGTHLITAMSCTVGGTAATVVKGYTDVGGSWNGSSWSVDSAGFTILYLLHSPPTGTQTVAFTITTSSGTADDIAAGSASYTGGSGTTQGLAFNDTASTYSVTVSGTTTGGIVVGCCGAGNSFTGTTSGTQRFENNASGSTTGSEGDVIYADKASSGSTVTITFTGTSTSQSIIGVELLAGGGATFVAGDAIVVGQGSTPGAIIGVANSPTITQASRRAAFY